MPYHHCQHHLVSSFCNFIALWKYHFRNLQSNLLLQVSIMNSNGQNTNSSKHNWITSYGQHWQTFEKKKVAFYQKVKRALCLCSYEFLPIGNYSAYAHEGSILPKHPCNTPFVSVYLMHCHDALTQHNIFMRLVPQERKGGRSRSSDGTQ